MERITLPNEIEADMSNFLKSLMDGVASVPIPLDDVLTTAPTTAGGELKEGQRGIYQNFLYETVNGTTYKYGTAV